MFDKCAMKIHEYQAKRILIKYGVKVPEGKVATTAVEAGEIARELGGKVAVKAQIHAGGRGKGGGIKLAQSAEEAQELAGQLLGSKLVTPQTGPEGKVTNCVLIEKGVNIEKEFYLGIVIDRSQQRPVFMASREGGVEIEEVAQKNPELILKEHVHPGVGLQAFQARKIAFGLGLEGKAVGNATRFMSSLYQAFESSDASLAEINPLVLTDQGELCALDAKMTFDDSGLYRHAEILEMRDLDEEEPLEIEASHHQLNYIKLDGQVGCMVNGAGLAMATMDIIKLEGASPANFLDVGGGATASQVTQAFKIILADPNVKAILVNIFGGIAKCDVIADGVVTAAREVGMKVPLIVRLEGTNVDEGKKILAESGLDLIPAGDMNDAAEKVIEAIGGAA